MISTACSPPGIQVYDLQNRKECWISSTARFSYSISVAGLEMFCLFIVGESTRELTPSVWYVSPWATKTRETPFALLKGVVSKILLSCHWGNMWTSTWKSIPEDRSRYLFSTIDFNSLNSFSQVGFVYCTLWVFPEVLKAPGAHEDS